MTSPEPTTEADLLGRDRCPNCLYDRRFTPADALCPECGYRLPAGVSVLTLRRQPVAVWQIAMVLLVIAFIVSANANASRNAVFWLGYLFLGVLFVATLTLSAMRWRRGDAEYVSQIWLSPQGIGLEPFADRFGLSRGIERAGAMALRWMPLAMPIWIMLAGSPLRVESIVVAGAFALVIGGVAAFVIASARRARLPAPDDVAPTMYRWDRVGPIAVTPRRAGQVTLFFRPAGFWAAALPLSIGFAGDAAFATRVEQAIADARRS